LLLTPGAALAQSAPSTPDRPSEGDLFGNTPPPAPAPQPAQPEKPAAPATTDEGNLEGGITQAQATAKLKEAYDKLAIGGFLYLRGEYFGLAEGDPKNFRIQSPNLFDTFLDARPADQVRGFARFRITYDPTQVVGSTDSFGRAVGSNTQFFIDQLWMKFDISRTLFLTIGKQRIKWGTGHIWNPTDFLNLAKLDPLAVYDLRLGVYLLKLAIPVESLGWNFYAIANADASVSPATLGGALRGEFLIGPVETALTADIRQEPRFGEAANASLVTTTAGKDPYKRPPPTIRLGVDASTAAGPFDVYFELALLHNLAQPFYDPNASARDFLLQHANDLPASCVNSGVNCVAGLRLPKNHDWYPQLVVGAELPILYSEQDSITIGAEYFYNSTGYPSEKIYPVLFLDGTFSPLYTGKHYLALYAVLPNPGDLQLMTFLVNAIANLSDRSGVLQFQYRVTVLQWVNIDAFAAAHFGSGEFRLAFNPLFTQDDFKFARDLGLTIPTAIATAVSRTVPAPDFELGVGAAMTF
jgi:hypothetical protein